jgi:hypothetical protein
MLRKTIGGWKSVEVEITDRNETESVGVAEIIEWTETEGFLGDKTIEQREIENVGPAEMTDDI